MPTLTDTVRDYLDNCGLFPEQIEAIVDQLNTEITRDDPEWPRRSKERADAYPIGMVGVLRLHARQIARTWLAEHAPNHWACALFE